MTVVPIYDSKDGSMYSIFFAADGSKEFIMPFRFDALLGSNMIFVPEDKGPQYTTEVIMLRELTGKTFVGWFIWRHQSRYPQYHNLPGQ